MRHIGITETGPNDPEQKMLARAIQDAPWEVIMLAYSLMNQGARRKIFPTTQRRGIGTLLMFVVRNIFSNAAYRRDIAAKLVEQGQLDASVLSDGDPLGFLVADGAAESITDAAYRYARHEQGVDVVLFGTGNKDSRRRRTSTSILRPALPAPVDRAASRLVRPPDRRRPRPARAGQGVETRSLLSSWSGAKDLMATSARRRRSQSP